MEPHHNQPRGQLRQDSRWTPLVQENTYDTTTDNDMTTLVSNSISQRQTFMMLLLQQKILWNFLDSIMIFMKKVIIIGCHDFPSSSFIEKSNCHVGWCWCCWCCFWFRSFFVPNLCLKSEFLKVQFSFECRLSAQQSLPPKKSKWLKSDGRFF